MECNFYITIKDSNVMPKICHIEYLFDAHDDLVKNVESIKKDAYVAEIAYSIINKEPIGIYIYQKLLGKHEIRQYYTKRFNEEFTYEDLKKYRNSGNCFDNNSWLDHVLLQTVDKEESKENKSIIETYGSNCNFYIRLGDTYSFAHIEHLFDTDFDLTMATSSNSIESRYIAEYKYTIGKKNPTGIYIYEKIDKNNKTTRSICGYSLLLAPLGTKDFDKNFTYKDLKKYRNSGKCFDNYSWLDYASDAIQTINKEESEEIKADPDIFKDWKDVNYIIWLHQLLTCNFKIRKQFNSVSAIREAEEHNFIEPYEDIILCTKDAAYIISYGVSRGVIEAIYVIYDQEVLEALERDSTSSIVFDLYSVNSCKANKYMAKPDVAATMKDILYNIILDTVTVHELKYNEFSYESEIKMNLWKDVHIWIKLNNKGEHKNLVITKAFLNPEDLMRAQFKSYIDNDDFVLVLGDHDKAYLVSMTEGSESIYIIAKEGLHREIYETDFGKYNLLYTFDVIGNTDIENPTDFIFDTPEMSEVILVKYTLYFTSYMSTNKFDIVTPSCLIEESEESIFIDRNKIAESYKKINEIENISIKNIESVRFDHPYTFVVWRDNTVVYYKANCNELFNREKGLAMCIAQKALGDDFEDVFKKFINED